MSLRMMRLAPAVLAATVIAVLFGPLVVPGLHAWPVAGTALDREAGPATTVLEAAVNARADDAVAAARWAKDDDPVSYAEPGEDLLAAMARAQLGPGASQVEIEAASDGLLAGWHEERYHGPDPAAHSRLVQGERRALAAGSSPQAMGMAVSGTMRLFVVAAEFAGSDTAANFSHPRSMTDRECITETITFTGPLHGQIPPPGERDNNTLWLPDFDEEYYESIIFGEEGVTERVRPDLTDPDDGEPGIDISGQTMQAFYGEASGGRVRLEPGPAGTLAWVRVPHSEAYYGASRCANGRAPDVTAMHGLPSNPSHGFGPRQLIVDIVDVINAEQPDFPWSEYDADGNGVIDHVVVFHAGKDKSNGGGVQSWQAIWAHRGWVDKVADDGGTPGDPRDDIRLRGYTMQYEDAEPGVLIHEFGHDLGLPDLYDTSHGGANSTEYWGVMGAGGRAGKLNSTHPVQMTTWNKFALGWSDPVVITPSATAQEVTVGQVTRPPEGTADAIRVNLPPIPIVDLDFPPGSTQAWWSNDDQQWADVRLLRDLDLGQATAPITVSFDLNIDSKRNWDFMFVEVSDDGGQTYTQTKGFGALSGAELTTPDDYADPNCRLGPHPDRPECPEDNYGGLRYGYTGRSRSWEGQQNQWLRVYHDLSPYAGMAISLRFRYATDGGSEGRGAYVDNITVTAGDSAIFEDAVENDDQNDWLLDVKSFSGDRLGSGWVMSKGTTYIPRYYLLEWRNLDGFDNGMRYLYNTQFSRLTEDGRSERRVDYLQNNVPGMVVWYRDLRFGQEPSGTNNNPITPGLLLAEPSEGSKGGLLVVDANPEPLRGPRGGVLEPADSESGETYGPYRFPPFDNWGGRVQTTNAAFGLNPTTGITLTVADGEEDPATTIYTPTFYAPLPAEPAFHDALGFYPGVEVLPEPIKTLSTTTTLRLKAYALADPDASVVTPAKGYYPPRTPAGFTGKGAETSPPSDSVSSHETIYNFAKEHRLMNVGQAGDVEISGEHSGHPGSDGLQFGNHFAVVAQAEDGSYGVVRLWSSEHEVEVGGALTHAERAVAGLRVTARMRNVGSPSQLALFSDFDEAHATFLAGSASDGALPVDADLETIQQLLRAGDVDGIMELVVDGSEARGVLWMGDAALDTGDDVSFRYDIAPQPCPALRVVNTGFGGDAERDFVMTTRVGRSIYVPAAQGGKAPAQVLVPPDGGEAPAAVRGEPPCLVRPGIVLFGLDDGWQATDFAAHALAHHPGGSANDYAAAHASANHPGGYANDYAAAAAALGGAAHVDERLADGVFAAVVPPGTEREAAQEIASLPGVRFADVDHQVRGFELPDDPRYGEQWGMREIGMPAAWDGVRDASSVPVAVLDTGATLDHPDLEEALWRNPGEVPGNGIDDDGNRFVDDIHGWRFYQDYSTGRAASRNNSDVGDRHGHGTHTAGIVGAVGNNGLGVAGVAWDARLMILRVLDDEAVGWESDVVRGLDYAVHNGARVINMSLGTPETARALERAIGRAEAMGVVVVAAAGNDGGPVSYPARDPRVLGVGATTRFARRAVFSAHGEGLDVLAPGTTILSTGHAQPYLAASGTSAAAPHVAGVVALMLAQDPELTPARVRACVRLVARDLGPTGWDPLHGWGLLDAARSVGGCGAPLLLPRAEADRPHEGVPLRP